MVSILFVFLVWNFLRIDTASHSASDTLRPFLVEGILALGFFYVLLRKKNAG